MNETCETLLAVSTNHQPKTILRLSLLASWKNWLNQVECHSREWEEVSLWQVLGWLICSEVPGCSAHQRRSGDHGPRATGRRQKSGAQLGMEMNLGKKIEKIVGVNQQQPTMMGRFYDQYQSTILHVASSTIREFSQRSVAYGLDLTLLGYSSVMVRFPRDCGYSLLWRITMTVVILPLQSWLVLIIGQYCWDQLGSFMLSSSSSYMMVSQISLENPLLSSFIN